MRGRPLLLLHVLRGTIGEEDSWYRPAPASPLVALGLSFPPFDDSGIAGRVEYKVNTVEWRQLFSAKVMVDDESKLEDVIGQFTVVLSEAVLERPAPKRRTTVGDSGLEI